jgi:glycine amidinotransferase
MTLIVNSWNEWDPLRRVILGRPEGSWIPAPEPAWWHDLPEGGYPLGSWGPFPQEMVDAAAQQMDDFASIMEARGITVDRIDIHPAMIDGRAVSTPDWTQLGQHSANDVRDLFLPVGNEIIESPSPRRSRWYEYLNLRPLFERYFREDPEFLWTSAPKPRLTDESFEKNYFYNFEHVWSENEKRQHLHEWKFQLTEKEPLWDAADGMRFGRDIFWNASMVTNRSGVDWLKRHLGAKGIRVHTVQFDGDLKPFHIDDSIIPLRPGLAMYNPEWPPITQEFEKLFRMNDWELIPAAEPHYVHEAKIRLFGTYKARSWISMNTLSLGPNTVCVESSEQRYMEQLDGLGFEVIPVPYRHVIPFEGSLHCTTLDVNREGVLEDYFPKQIAGF